MRVAQARIVVGVRVALFRIDSDGRSHRMERMQGMRGRAVTINSTESAPRDRGNAGTVY